MPLQNRVTPFADLVAVSARGTLFGNRGGKFHRDDRTLSQRRWASRQWICCALDFKGRQRDVWGRFYTELFFLDEVTAFAAGHRPCFECRRKDAQAFAALFPRAHKAPDMDTILHRERLEGRAKRINRRAIDTLPDGAMIARNGEAFAVRGTQLMHWTPAGYDRALRRPRGIDVDVLTPPSIIKVLERGYAPLWHSTVTL
ncbi:hypothetical protein [Pseudolabrys sp. FHR47]|uniref:hypothetical protein n=1 Tax=Pseudolabrys sp. FHR47 TaxID=2562284 RepID=UPI0010BE3B7C|nr:hypothetical protein [Pseudolabrys sp. FHR47]